MGYKDETASKKMTKESFTIDGLGGKLSLSGEIKVGGAKNAALKVMASSILFGSGIKLTNVPEIEDVYRMNELLADMGAKVKREAPHKYFVDASSLKHMDLDYQLSKRMRASVVLTGPLLARYKKVSFPHPGGCVIGARPIDLFLEGFRKMGAKAAVRGKRYVITAPKGGLRGAEMFFGLQSVTATETFLMTAVLAKGKTILKNCAMEPEIKSLADYLSSCGARIKGAGGTTIEIEGTGPLEARGKIYDTLPDRIEAGSFLILGACAGKKLSIKNCRPEHFESLTHILRELGVKMEIGGDYVVVKGGRPKAPQGEYQIKTHEYPGLATDLQAPLVVLLTQTEGESRVHETIFDGRLAYTQDLVKMGANITLWDSNRATIKGRTALSGKELEGPDIRAGLAFVIAAILAEGRSVISNVYLIDRGYENVEKRLLDIGVKIKRISL